MRKSWFFPRELALRLARHEVTNREAAYLVLASLLFGTVMYYSGITWANPIWSFLSLYEWIAVVAVSLFGFSQCFHAGGGDSNADFIRDYTCLSFPVWLWSNVIVWSTYWLGIWLFRQGAIAAYNFQGLGFAKNLYAIGGNFNWLWTFLATVGLQAIYFAWMTKALNTCAETRLEV